MSNKFEALARAGYAARGVVYMLLGGLAVTSAFRGSGDTEGSSGAMSSLLTLPFGRILLALIAIGLVGHILWRLAQGFLDADGVGSDSKGLAARCGSLISAGANLFLALTAARMAVGQSGGNSGGGGEDQASAWLLQQPFGGLLLGVVALGIIAAGGTQIWKAASHKYRKRLDIPSSLPLLDATAFFGLIARGVLMGIVGGFVFYAAVTFSPERAGGISEALDYIHALPFGAWLYVLAAIGLVAFGGCSVVEALYRRMSVPDLGQIKDALPG